MEIKRYLAIVPFGSPALKALRAAIDAAQASDRLAPVTVVVPSAYAGLAARRALAAPGLANCRFVSLGRVAELLGTAALAAAGRLPLPHAVCAEAVRQVIAADAGWLGRAAGHPRTVRSLTSTLAELRALPAPLLDRLAASGQRGAALVRLHQAVRDRLRHWYDEHDLMAAAADAVRAGPAHRDGLPHDALRDVGHVVLYLPRELSAAEHDLCAVLAGRSLLSAVLGATGDPEADRLTWALVDRLEPLLGPAARATPAEPAVADRVISVPDPEEEVRAAIREAMTYLRRDGLSLHRVAFLYPTPSPYAVIAAEELRAAGIPFNGPDPRTLAQTVAGRCVRGLLNLAGTDLPRKAVMAWLAGGPILERPRGGLAPAARWEQIARKAGIVREPWAPLLDRYARECGDEWEAEHAARLAAFIEELAVRLRPGDAAHSPENGDQEGSWTQLARWAGGLIDRYLGPEERDAVSQVRAALGGLAVIGRSQPSRDVFRLAVERELEAPVGSHGQDSSGVFVGALTDALGTDFDVLVVLGMAEGQVPPPDRGHSLLPWGEASARRASQRRAYLAALATARQARVLTFSRSDPRAGRARLPSRWLLETASRHAGRAVYSEDLAQAGAQPWHERVPSFTGGLVTGEPASPRDRDLRSLLAWAPRDVASHPLVTSDPRLAAGIAAQRARASEHFSPWDGNVGPHPRLSLRGDRPVSVTALQDYAVCGMRYLLRRELGVEERTEPAQTRELAGLDRARLIRQVLAQGGDAEQVCNQAAPQLWAAELEALLGLLARLPEEAERLRGELGTVGGVTDYAFGDSDPSGDGPPVIVALPDGGSVALRGRIDRLDWAPDRSRATVIVSKTGRTRPEAYRKALEADPVAGGQLLQLPVDALAARALLGEVPVRAVYWFISDVHDFARLVIDLDDETMRRFTEVLAVIVGGIEAGRFPAHQGALATSGLQNCDHCPYDLVCPADRVRAWERKREAPELAPYARLVEQ